jgi:hypothetical protein
VLRWRRVVGLVVDRSSDGDEPVANVAPLQPADLAGTKADAVSYEYSGSGYQKAEKRDRVLDDDFREQLSTAIDQAKRSLGITVPPS